MKPYYTISKDGKTLLQASRVLVRDGKTMILGNPEDFAHYLSAYPKAATDPAPIPPEGKVAEVDGYHLESNEWRRTWRFEDAPPPPPKVYSTADAIEVLMKEEVWPQCRAWIEEQGLLDLVLVTKEFSSDLENFDLVIGGLQQLLGWSDEKVAEVLAEAEI